MADYIRTTNLKETMEVMAIFKSLGYVWFDDRDPVTGKTLRERVYYFKNSNRFGGTSWCPEGSTCMEAPEFINLHSMGHTTMAPSMGSRYWTLLPGLGIMSTVWEGSEKDRLRLAFNNVFLQRECATKAMEGR